MNLDPPDLDPLISPLIKRHVDSEKTRHRTETEALQKEVEELKETLANLKAGKNPTNPKEEVMEDLEELLDPYDGEKGELKAQLDKATKEKELMQQQLIQMQTQMTEFMMTYGQQRANSPGIGTPPMLNMTPEQPVKPPASSLQDGANLATGIAKKRDALQPFGVARPEGLNHKTGPYDKSAEKTTPVNLESPDRWAHQDTRIEEVSGDWRLGKRVTTWAGQDGLAW